MVRTVISTQTKSCKKRLAFTMIELIFAIVIIGISMLALPTMMLQDASSQEGSLMQEGVLISTTKVSQVLTFPWDTNSSPLVGLMSTSQVLDTANGDAALNRVAATDFRIGHVQEKLRRRLTPNSDPRSALTIPVPAGGNPSISDFHNQLTEINATVGFEQWAYKKRWQTLTTVSYVADAATYAGVLGVINDFDFRDVTLPAGQTSNIKMIRVTATDITPGGAGTQVQLSSYSSNIGEAEFYKRRY